jgi:hypothetical protein
VSIAHRVSRAAPYVAGSRVQLGRGIYATVHKHHEIRFRARWRWQNPGNLYVLRLILPSGCCENLREQYWEEDIPIYIWGCSKSMGRDEY